MPGCFPDSKVAFYASEQWNCLIFSFGLGVTFGPGRGTAGGCSVTPCQKCFPDSKGVFWLAFCALDKFRSDVWPWQRDGRRLFRQAVPGCFPDSKGFCALEQFRSDVWPVRGTAGGCSVTPCQGVFLIRRVSCALASAPGTVELPASTLIFSFTSGVTFGPGRGTAGGCSVTPCEGVFLIRRVSSGLLSVPWNSGRTAGGCSVTPCQGVFLTRRCLLGALEQWNCLPEP